MDMSGCELNGLHGIAIEPTDGELVAPADGEISSTFETHHAVGMTTADGAELLMHIGIDTVKLGGKHFTYLVNEGDKVKKGQPLIRFELEAIKAEGYPVTTPLIVCKLDSIVEEVVRQIFAQFREVSRKKLLESVKTNDAARIQKKIKKIQKDLEAKQKELDDLKAETILVIRGVSALDKELLGTLVAEAREALETLEKQLVQAQEEYEEATKTAKRSNYICNELFTWADVYDTANHDERRAILQQFITEIRVRKDYEISITLNASFNQVEQLKAVSTYDGAEIFEEISEKGA